MWNGKKDIFFLVALFLLLATISVCRNQNRQPSVIWCDAEGYYRYLPAFFIQHDFHHLPFRSMNYLQNDKGENVMKYTCGVAYFTLPFFLAAHAYAHIFHCDTSGFSPPYYFAMMISGAFWATIGLYFLRRLLARFFRNGAAWITVLCILVGTNFSYYALREMGMSHIYSFLLFALLLLTTSSYYEAPSRRKMFLIAFFFGWVLLIRPTNCIMGLALVLLNVSSLSDLKERVLFLKSRVADIALSVPFFILPLVPQLLYWKMMWGKWIVYTYKGESFIYWKAPKIPEVLFDPVNGLFLYSPVILFALPALFIARKDRRTNVVAVTLTFMLITYTFASWWCWNFGGAFGHRCYIEYLPLFAFPFAMTIERVLMVKRKFMKIAVFSLLFIMAYYGVAMSKVYEDETVSSHWNWHQYGHLIYRVFTWT